MKRYTVLVVAVVALLLTAVWQLAEARERKIPMGKLPKAVRAKIEKEFPGATMVKAEAEQEEEILVYEARIKHKGEEKEVVVSSNGHLLEVETVVAEAALPKGVREALAEAAKGGKIYKIEKTELLAAVKVVKLAKPEVSYEAKFTKDGRHVEIEFAPDGKVLKKESGAEAEDEEGEEEEDEEEAEEGEEKVTLDQVPAAVRATILKEAGKNKIEEIEKETKGGRTLYEAVWKSEGKEVEIVVAPDGKLLEKEVEGE